MLAHKSVMVSEVLVALLSDIDATYVDCTCGNGGHSAELLKRLSTKGRVIAMDCDREAVAHNRRRFATERRFEIIHTSFAMLRAITDRFQVTGKIAGILFDLGVSTHQLRSAQRGFSFDHDGQLDMRFDQSIGESAATWLATTGYAELVRVLSDYGEERMASRIARRIIAVRENTPIQRTTQLMRIVNAAKSRAPKRKINPATLTFQAIRIHVNRELVQLKDALQQTWAALRPGGRLAVISFHSLEDRIVKRFMRAGSQNYTARRLPFELPPQQQPLWHLIGGPQRPDSTEIETNPSSRSAILRVAEKQCSLPLTS